ncbi:toll/interleukin-1 receptor domain-containing protein [Micromonospora echinospora]|uniref:toll/interleukin-1 receptor domain-containing protein n=1 Tax=Micromonospora echinospora TaxID=1877 RepID=UPI003A8AE4C4
MSVNWELVVAAISMVAGAAAAYFGYVAVRGRLRPPRSSPRTAGTTGADTSYHAFVSYAEADEATAVWLAEGLQARGLRVFLAKWIGVGLVEYAEKERALSASAHGVLLFSKASMGRADIRDEYAALLQQAHAGDRRFVPVLVDAVTLPPFARIRRPLDLTRRGGSDAALDELARAIGPPSARRSGAEPGP